MILTIEFSYVNPIQGSFAWLTLISCNCNTKVFKKVLNQVKKYIVISGVFFDKKLYFQQHIYYYANKALFTIKDIKMVGNSTRELSPMYKHPLYRICVFSTTLYGF